MVKPDSVWFRIILAASATALFTPAILTQRAEMWLAIPIIPGCLLVLIVMIRWAYFIDRDRSDRPPDVP